MKNRKGEYGYIRSEKLRRLLRTVLLFGIAFGIFAVGLVLNNGDRRNIYSIVAAVGCIPGAMSMTGLIMIWLRRPMKEDLYREISAGAGSLLMLYELYLTTQDKNMFLDAAAVCGEYVMAYTSEKASSGEIAFMEQHIRRSMQAGGGYRMTAKIYTDTGKYLERLAQLQEHRKPEDAETDLKKAEVLKGIAL